jgi:hypothetical protein
MAIPKLEEQAGKLNMVIEQGTTFNPILTYTDENNVAIDLTGYTARMQIRLKRTSAAFLHELTTEGVGIVLGGVAGTITLLITDTDTMAFTFKSAVYDLELISAGGIVTRLLRGSVSLSTEATK